MLQISYCTQLGNAAMTQLKCIFSVLQDKAENFVMAALFCASEEGNVQGLKDLLNMAQNIDLQTANRVRMHVRMHVMLIVLFPFKSFYGS